MKNAFVRIGWKCASLAIAGGLMTGAAMAETRDLAYVTLPNAVTVGSTTLPSGHYTIMDAGYNVFLLQSDKGDRAILFGHEMESPKEAPRTEVVLKSDGEALRLDKLYLSGETTGYEFGR